MKARELQRSREFLRNALDEIDVVQERRQLIDDYLIQLGPADSIAANVIAHGLKADEKPLARLIAIVPVAAHQEAPQIATAMEQYAKQETTSPFTVVLGLNTPIEQKDSEGLQKTIDEVDKAKERHPNLDIRTSLTFYDSPKIGHIRRDLWNGVITASRDSGQFNTRGDVIGINHDIDILWLGSTLMNRVASEYNQEERISDEVVLRPSATNLSHGLSSAHPNSSKAISWKNYTDRLMDLTYEAGYVIPMSYYANSGGFNKDAYTHEAISIVGSRHFKMSVIDGTTTVSSPRRFLEKLDKQGYLIWSKPFFTPYDRCREQMDFPDITIPRRDEVIGASICAVAQHVLAPIALRASLRFILADGDIAGDQDEVIAAMSEIAKPKATKAHRQIAEYLLTISPSESLQKTLDIGFSETRLNLALKRQLRNRLSEEDTVLNGNL